MATKAKRKAPTKAEKEAAKLDTQLAEQAAALVVRTARVAPEFVADLLWALLKSSRYSRALRSGPSGATVAALVALVPETREIFEASQAGTRRIRAAEVAALTVEDLPADELSAIGFAALVLQLPEDALPLVSRLLVVNAGFRHIEVELVAIQREFEHYGEVLPTKAKKLLQDMAALVRPDVTPEEIQ